MLLPLDSPKPVRPGEELAPDLLLPYLLKHLPAASGSLEIAQFPHGHSNLTYLLSIGQDEFILRRPPFGNRVKTAHDMNREFQILTSLQHVYEPAPKPFLYCGDDAILGAPFYIMERRRGIILRAKTAPDPQTLRAAAESLVENLALLHAINYQAAGLAHFGRPEGYIERQVLGWTKRYRDAQTEALPDLDRVAAWLDANRSPDSGAAVIHNDFKFDNLLLDPDDPSHVVAVLDWEMATIGDPLMDLGTTLAYWVEPNDPPPLQALIVGPTSQPGALTRLEIVARYEQAAHRTVANPLFYYIFGLYKVAVIVQQIYARYARGATSDPRFATMGSVVAALSQGASLAIDSNHI